MSDNVADCMKYLEDFRVCVRECHGKTERSFPRAPLRDVKDAKPTAEQIDALLSTLTKTKDSLEDYKKLIDDIENTLLKTKIHFLEDKGLRGLPGRQRAADSGYYSVASCDLAQMSIEEERNNPLIVQAGDQAEQAESVMPEIQETPSEISWSQPSEHTDSCESDTEA